MSVLFADLKIYSECGGNHTDASGLLTSPFYPNDSYPNNAECDYLITSPNGTFINITIVDFDIPDGHERCLHDFVEFRDGSSKNASVIGKLCDNELTLPIIPMTLYSSQNYMRIRYLYT